MEDNNGKKATVLLTVIGLATLLVAVIGATFAYFSTIVVNGNNATPANIKTGSVGTIEYIEGTSANISGLNLTSNWVGVLPFSVTNSGDVDQYIQAKWLEVDSDLCAVAAEDGSSCTGTQDVKGDFTWDVYDIGDTDAATVTLENYTTAISGQTAINSGYLATTQNNDVILPTTTTIPKNNGKKNYVLVLKFNYLADAPAVAPRTSNNQNYQQGKSFVGRLDVSWVDVAPEVTP